MNYYDIEEEINSCEDIKGKRIQWDRYSSIYYIVDDEYNFDNDKFTVLEERGGAFKYSHSKKNHLLQLSNSDLVDNRLVAEYIQNQIDRGLIK